MTEPAPSAWSARRPVTLWLGFLLLLTPLAVLAIRPEVYYGVIRDVDYAHPLLPWYPVIIAAIGGAIVAISLSASRFRAVLMLLITPALIWVQFAAPALLVLLLGEIRY